VKNFHTDESPQNKSQYLKGHTTGSTYSTWSPPWTTLHYWTPPNIVAVFRQYWDLTVTANDKIQPVASRAGAISTISLQPSKQTFAGFLIWAYQRLIVLQYRANNLRATLTLSFGVIETSYLENLIIFFETPYKCPGLFSLNLGFTRFNFLPGPCGVIYEDR